GEINLESESWILPASRTKNGLAHVVPLVGEAFEIVRNRLSVCDREPDAALFAHVAGKPIEPNAIAQAVRKKLQIFDEPWTPHDARRSAATGMAGIGIFPHIIEAVLNHISGFRGGVAGVYNRNQYEPEKRAALLRWTAEIYAPAHRRNSNVVAMIRSD
ncbi:MAG: tyrosine-type recombinase/integrase, partial [Gimesia chilikensis]